MSNTFDQRMDAELRERGIDPDDPNVHELIAACGYSLATQIEQVRLGGAKRWRILAALLVATAAELDEHGARYAFGQVTMAAGRRA